MLARLSTSSRGIFRPALLKSWAAPRVTGTPLTPQPVVVVARRCLTARYPTPTHSTGENSRKTSLKWAAGLAMVGALGLGLTYLFQDHIEARLLCYKYEKLVGDPQLARKPLSVATKEEPTDEEKNFVHGPRLFALYTMARALKRPDENDQAEVAEYLKRIMILHFISTFGTEHYRHRAPAFGPGMTELVETTHLTVPLHGVNDDELSTLVDKADKEFRSIQRKTCRAIWDTLHDDKQSTAGLIPSVVIQKATYEMSCSPEPLAIGPDPYFLDAYKRLVVLLKAQIYALEAQSLEEGEELSVEVLG